jgi:tetratricopeptide (TPR) repeat protein
MAIFKKFFAPSDPLTKLRKAFSRGQWAEVLALGKALDPSHIAADNGAELTELLDQAGDRLAELNLQEAEAFLRAGDEARAREHLELAASLAAEAGLRARILALSPRREAPPRPATPIPAPILAPSCGCGSECSTPGPAPDSPLDTPSPADTDLDLDTRLDLCLGGYPEGAVDRYLALGAPLKAAVVLAHGGETQAALEAFAEVPAADQQEDFHYERGVLLARQGEVDAAAADLERCLDLDPAHPLAGDVLFNLLLGAGRLEPAATLVQRVETAGCPASFCLARRAILQAVAGDYDQALPLAEAAYGAGSREGELLILFAQLLERQGRVDQAEQIYVQTAGGGGCGGGGISVPLAEFWLRHKRQLDRVLEGFKGLWQQEPGNPLWMLRTGQTYLAKGWTEQGRELLRRLVERNDIPAELFDEARQALDAPEHS